MTEELRALGIKVDKLAEEVAILRGWIKGLTLGIPFIGILIGYIYLQDISRLNEAVKILEHREIAFNKDTVLYVRNNNG
jgi:hypothetical protein